jgi:hypothetical protein
MDLGAAILVLGVLNHFIRAASRQKKKGDDIPEKTGNYANMLRQSSWRLFHRALQERLQRSTKL